MPDQLGADGVHSQRGRSPAGRRSPVQHQQVALGLEGIREWVHERNLVREARASLVSELRDNQRELARTLGGDPRDADEPERRARPHRARGERETRREARDQLLRRVPGRSLLGVNRSTAETTGRSPT
jgi:hypothetical protein